MSKILVITPVKNSLETTLETARGVAASTMKVKHIIYNDFSTPETRQALEENKAVIGYELVNLQEVTKTPSPNYKLVLQLAQKRALELDVPLVVIESDVLIKPQTIEELHDFLIKTPKAGLVGAITVGENGKVNFPYLKFKKIRYAIVRTNRSLSFCCTIFSRKLLEAFDFKDLDSTKDWYDTFVSKKSIELGFENYILMDVPVLHRPHGSRTWKQLKYKNPLKYYFLKYWKGLDKI